jgi:hypothetical protein
MKHRCDDISRVALRDFSRFRVAQIVRSGRAMTMTITRFPYPTASTALVALLLSACSAAPSETDQPTGSPAAAAGPEREHRRCNPHVQLVTPGDYLQNPTIVRVYWAYNFSTIIDHEVVWQPLAPSIDYWARLGWYGVGIGKDGSFGGDNLFTLPTWVPESTIQSTLQSEMDNGFIPTPAGDVIYVVYLPDGIHSQWNQGSTSTGHHASFTKDGTRYAYAVLDGVGTDAQIDGTATHEVAEAATDPDLGKGWNVPSMVGGEVADLCAPKFDTIAGFDSVAQVYSERTCSCL